jgi:hypothetical protein
MNNANNYDLLTTNAIIHAGREDLDWSMACILTVEFPLRTSRGSCMEGRHKSTVIAPPKILHWIE